MIADLNKNLASRLAIALPAHQTLLRVAGYGIASGEPRRLATAPILIASNCQRNPQRHNVTAALRSLNCSTIPVGDSESRLDGNYDIRWLSHDAGQHIIR